MSPVVRAPIARVLRRALHQHGVRARRAAALAIATGAIVACGASAVHAVDPPRPSASAPVRGDAIPLLPEGRIGARAIAMNEDSVCVLLVDGSVWCVGQFYSNARSPAVSEMPIPKVRALVTNKRMTFAITETKEVFYWGAASVLDASRLPKRLDVDGVDEVDVSSETLCVRRGDSAACRTFGATGWTPLGTGARAVSTRPSETCFADDARVTCIGPSGATERRLANVVEMVASDTLTCARRATGDVRCWRAGDHTEMQLFGERPFSALSGNSLGVCAQPLRGAPKCALEIADDGTSGYASIDEALQSHRGASSLTVGTKGACFIEAGAPWCWGRWDVVHDAREPEPVDLGDLASLRSAREIAVGDDHRCIVGTDDLLRCWGGDDAGVLGFGDGLGRAGPERVKDLPPIAHVAARGVRTCVVTKAAGGDDGGRVLCAGGDTTLYGAPDCGDPKFPCQDRFTLVTTGAKEVSVGDHFACVLDVDGGVRCWGRNSLGQLGNGSTEDAPGPVPVIDASGAPLSRVRKVVAGYARACALLAPDAGKEAEGGAVVCWGYDDPGMQGRPLEPLAKTPTDPAVHPYIRSAAAVVPLPSGAIDVSDRCALLVSGEARCWGDMPGGGFAITPSRVGLCDARSLVDACTLGANGIACLGRDPRARAKAYEGPPIVSWAVGALETCGVDAKGHAACTFRDDDGPAFGDLPVTAPASACATDDLDGAPPIALWFDSTVETNHRSRDLRAEDVNVLAEAMRAPTVGPELEIACRETRPQIVFAFGDLFGQPRGRFEYVPAPCDALIDRDHPDAPGHRPTGEARTLFALIRSSLRPGPERP